MQADEVRRRLTRFFQARSTILENLARREHQLLELLSLTAVVRHYEAGGFRTIPQNLRAGRFRVKLSSKGYPWNFSYFELIRDGEVFEIRANIAVHGASTEDDGCYVVDVGVVQSGVIPTSRPKDAMWVVGNEALLTFVEAKDLVIYPMLLAQFIGIVHELLPRFIHQARPDGYEGVHISRLRLRPMDI